MATQNVNVINSTVQIIHFKMAKMANFSYASYYDKNAYTIHI